MLLVRTVSGPAEAVAGSTAVYRATTFNIPNPTPAELRQINWIVESGGEVIARFNAAGDTLNFDVPASLAGRAIRVMPFRNTPTRVVSVLSQVVSRAGGVSAGGGLMLLTRADWGARTDLPRLGAAVDRSRRTHVFIHHTVVVDDDSTANVFESLEEVRRHMRRLQTVREQDLGPDVPYSFVAFCMSGGELVLCEGRGFERSGAHTRGHNTPALGISFQGNFEDSGPPPRLDSQLATLSNWLRALREEGGFTRLGTVRPLGREVFGHQDVKATACPGSGLFDRLRLIRFL